MIRTLMLALFALVPLGCGGEEKQAPPADAPPATGAIAKLTLAQDPGDALNVREAKDAAPLDDVAVVGRIDNIVGGFATFNLVDTELEYCGQTAAENCPTPWDYCCIAPDDKSEGTLTVEALGPDGAVLETESLPGLRLLDLVVVEGKLVKDEHGNVTVQATGWHRRERPQLPDGLRWPE